MGDPQRLFSFTLSPGQMDVHCFLLTDILLICKAIAKKGHGTLKVRSLSMYICTVIYVLSSAFSKCWSTLWGGNNSNNNIISKLTALDMWRVLRFAKWPLAAALA